jgi:hypothetical protein
VQVGLEVPGNDSVVNPVKNALNIDGKSALNIDGKSASTERLLPSHSFCQKGEESLFLERQKGGESR